MAEILITSASAEVVNYAGEYSFATTWLTFSSSPLSHSFPDTVLEYVDSLLYVDSE